MSEPERVEDECWCDHCNRLARRVDLRMDKGGALRCPHCGESLIERDADPTALPQEDAPKAPWHFKVLLVGTVIYLIYRLIWFILWVSHRA